MIYIGKIVSTHGIKGEIKIKSTYKYKDKVFNIGNEIIIENQKFIINTYRVHKNLDMITLKGIDNINLVLKYINSKVYVESVSLEENEYNDTDLINMDMYMKDELIGKVKSIEYINNNNLFILDNNKMIPYNESIIENIDFKNKKIYIIYMEGLV